MKLRARAALDGQEAIDAVTVIVDSVPDRAVISVPRRERPSRLRRRTLGEAGATLGAWLIGALFFFSAQWTSGFDRLMGNTGDTRLQVYLSEQWFLVLRGAQPWRDPPFFHPVKGILGYTDTFFLYEIFFAPFRLLHADPFFAFQLTLIAMSLMGFVCFVVLARMLFRAPLVLALVGALVFTFANNLWLHEGSDQLFGIYFAPPIALIGLAAWRTRQRRPLLSIALGALFGLLSSLFLFSTYYVAWFSMFAGVVVFVFVCAFAPRVMKAEVVGALTTGWRSLLGAVAGAVLGLVPFWLTYIPVLDQLGSRNYGNALFYAAKWNDVINVGAGNVLWGGLFHNSWSAPSPASYEDSYALTPVLMLTVIAGAVAILVALLARRTKLTASLRVALALCSTVILFAVFPIDTHIGSLWVVVWNVPGATAIRAIDRIEVAASLVAAFALVALGTEALRHWQRLRASAVLRALAAILLIVILAEQLNSTSPSQMRRSAQIALLASVPPASAGCTSFFVTDSVRNHLHFYEYQTEAMMISQRVGLPTINGYSGDNPPGWNLGYPELPGYLAYVKQWTTMHGLTTGVCDFDLGTNKWRTHPLAS
jgi:hypothetical protein